MQLESSHHTNTRKRKASVAFDDEFDYLYGIVTTASDWYFLMYTPERIYCSKDDYHIVLNEKIMKDDAELRRGVKKVMGIMPTELEVLNQRITELESKNIKLEAENAELRKENTEISYLRNKLSVSDAEIAELKRSNIEFLRANKEHNERRDAENAKLRAENVEFRDRLTKVEQKQTLQSACKAPQWLTANDNSSNISSSNFNLVADQVPTVTHHEKSLVDTSLPEEVPEGPDKETDAFLDEEYKKKVSPVNADDGNPNSINDDSDSSDSEEEMPDDSDDDDGYNGYGGYNEYGECDRGYYYRDGRYERKTSPMMSPIISPVTA
ncbi:unnamed protein product [Rhizophagus irregularis]|nr:unnamed protein product [Rhizophagus irregularis]